MDDSLLNINNIAIIGLGLLGGSIGKAIKKSNAQIEVSAFDKNDIINKAIPIVFYISDFEGINPIHYFSFHNI